LWLHVHIGKKKPAFFPDNQITLITINLSDRKLVSGRKSIIHLDNTSTECNYNDAGLGRIKLFTRLWMKPGMRTLAGICLLWLTATELQAQTDTTFRRREIKILGFSLDTLLKNRIESIDTNYIASYYDYLHVHVLGEARDYYLQLLGTDRRINYTPHGASAVGLGFGYRWLNFDLSFKVPFLQQLNPGKGETDQFGANLGLIGRTILFNINYQSYKGLFINNPQVVDSNWFAANEAYPRRGDLQTKTLYTFFNYYFNSRRFSNPATLFRRERQKKSAGSFLVGVSYAFSHIGADSSLVPEVIRPSFPEDAEFIRYRSSNFSLNAGYTHTFVYKKYLFANFAFRPGMAISSTNNITTNGETVSMPERLSWLGDSRVIVGYNDNRYYGGVSYSLVFMSDNLQVNSNLRSYYTYVRFMVGRRFYFKPKGILRHIPGFG